LLRYVGTSVTQYGTQRQWKLESLYDGQQKLSGNDCWAAGIFFAKRTDPNRDSSKIGQLRGGEEDIPTETVARTAERRTHPNRASG
jgi:hypothetical protein